MNIQIFGSKKDFDTKKAERYFSDRLVHWTNRLDAKAKERGIKAQFIDMKEKGARGPVDLGFAPTGAERRP